MNIPENLDECFAHLDSMLSSEAILQMKIAMVKNECDVDDTFNHWLHMGLGMNLRNDWGLWHDSPLAKWFNDHNVWHADDMSGIILESYKRYLKGDPIELESQAQYYDNYWKNQNIDIKAETLAARKK